MRARMLQRALISVLTNIHQMHNSMKERPEENDTPSKLMQHDVVINGKVSANWQFPQIGKTSSKYENNYQGAVKV